jgi:hypothetical protein
MPRPSRQTRPTKMDQLDFMRRAPRPTECSLGASGSRTPRAPGVAESCEKTVGMDFSAVSRLVQRGSRPEAARSTWRYTTRLNSTLVPR